MLLGAGQTLSVVFSPDDTVNYTTATATVSVNVISGTSVATGLTDAATGLPIGGVDEWIYDSGGAIVATTQTDVNGVYATPLLPTGDYHVRTFNNRGYIDRWRQGADCLAACGTGGGVAVTVTAGVTQADIDVALAKGGSVEGWAADAATGGPIANMSVDILDDQGRFISSSWTRTDGTYSSAGPGGSYRARTSNSAGYQDQLYDCDVRRR